MRPDRAARVVAGPVAQIVAGTAAAVIVLGAGGCGKNRQKRASDAAPVEVVERPLRDEAADGGTLDEVEPNDGAELATQLPLGSTARGRLDTNEDVDHFRLDIIDEGALTIELTGVDGVDLALELVDAAGQVIATSNRGAARVREGVPNAAVTPGRYVVVVRGEKVVPPSKKKSKKAAKGKKGAAAQAEPVDAGTEAPSPIYELTARMSEPGQGVEREPNEDRGTALDLIIGDTASGYVGWSGDEDVWKLSVETLSDNNAIDVEVSPVEGVALTLKVADGIGRTLVTRKGPRGQAVALRGLVPVLPPGASPFHYLTVTGDRSNPETAYQLRATARLPAIDAEIEPNDTAETAMPVPVDRTVVHGTWTPGDVDHFVLGPDAVARTLEVSVDVAAESDLSVELVLGDKVLAKSANPGKGAAERVTAAVPAGAQPVLRVRGQGSSGEGAYKVHIAEGPPPAVTPSP